MRILMGVLLFVLAWSLMAWAETPSPRDLLQVGTLEAGVMAGYLVGVDTRRSVSNNRGALYILPRLGTVASGEVGRGLFIGRFQLLAEPLYAHYFKPFSATAAGESLLLKCNFVTFGRWVPYLEAGAGLLWSDLLPALKLGSPFNFVLQAGSGVQYFLSPSYPLRSGCVFITSPMEGPVSGTSASMEF